MESKPMKADELGRYVCVAHGGCLHSPSITITQDGVWVKAGELFSSAHRDCFEAWQARERRPIMTRDELKAHHVSDYGRDYSESCDGYEDMEAEEGRGWRALGIWGRDGWDLGQWPYVVIYVKTTGTNFDLMQIVEGDRSVYRFDKAEDREAAIDYLFLWYAAGNGQHWAPITPEQRELLDTGYPLAINDKWRGPCRV